MLFQAQIDYLKKELSRHQCDSHSLTSAGKDSSVSSQAICTAAMETHLSHLEEKLNEGKAVVANIVYS